MNDATKRTNEQALAMAFVIILNWVIAHLATSWALPSEVESAVQSCLVIMISWYANQTQQRDLMKQLDMAKAAGWTAPPTTTPPTAPIPPVVTTPDPAPVAPEPKATI